MEISHANEMKMLEDKFISDLKNQKNIFDLNINHKETEIREKSQVIN